MAQHRETRSFGTFSGIDLKTFGTVHLRQGPIQNVAFEGNPELLKKISSTVENGHLVITFTDKTSWKNNGDLDIYITIKDVESLRISGSGSILAETKIITPSLKIKLSGSGNIRAEAEVSNDIDVASSGSGNIELRGHAKNFRSKQSGSGNLTLAMRVKEDVSFEISGSGDVRAEGTATNTSIKIAGSGKISASDLKTDTCDVSISGSGDVDIHVNESLTSTIRGSGTVVYSGNPKRVNNSASGSGSVRKK
jgi:hypothetical protein